MRDRTEYETGEREPKPLTGKDPNDDFSQRAAGNKPPKRGAGLSETPSPEQRQRQKISANQTAEKDSAGQSETHHKGGTNNGMSSANPRVLSGKESGDATFPLKKN